MRVMLMVLVVMLLGDAALLGMVGCCPAEQRSICTWLHAHVPSAGLLRKA